MCTSVSLYLIHCTKQHQAALNHRGHSTLLFCSLCFHPLVHVPFRTSLCKTLLALSFPLCPLGINLWVTAASYLTNLWMLLMRLAVYQIIVWHVINQERQVSMTYNAINSLYKSVTRLHWVWLELCPFWCETFSDGINNQSSYLRNTYNLHLS